MSTQLKDYLQDALDMVAHESTIEAFYHRFIAIKSLLAEAQPEIPESYFATRFLYGLLPEFQSFIHRFQPTTVMAAYRLALIFEESIYLDYFPENEMSTDDLCEGVLGEDFPLESTIVLDSAESNLGEGGSIDTVDVDSGVLLQSLDSPDSLDVLAALQSDNVSSTGFRPSIPSSEATHRPSLVGSVQQRVVRDVLIEEDQIGQSPDLGNAHNNAMALLVIKELKVHPPDMAVQVVPSVARVLQIGTSSFDILVTHLHIAVHHSCSRDICSCWLTLMGGPNYVQSASGCEGISFMSELFDISFRVSLRFSTSIGSNSIKGFPGAPIIRKGLNGVDLEIWVVCWSSIPILFWFIFKAAMPRPELRVSHKVTGSSYIDVEDDKSVVDIMIGAVAVTSFGLSRTYIVQTLSFLSGEVVVVSKELSVSTICRLNDQFAKDHMNSDSAAAHELNQSINLLKICLRTCKFCIIRSLDVFFIGSSRNCNTIYARVQLFTVAVMSVVPMAASGGIYSSFSEIACGNVISRLGSNYKNYSQCIARYSIISTSVVPCKHYIHEVKTRPITPHKELPAFKDDHGLMSDKSFNYSFRMQQRYLFFVHSHSVATDVCIPFKMGVGMEDARVFTGQHDSHYFMSPGNEKFTAGSLVCFISRVVQYLLWFKRDTTVIWDAKLYHNWLHMTFRAVNHGIYEAGINLSEKGISSTAIQQEARMVVGDLYKAGYEYALPFVIAMPATMEKILHHEYNSAMWFLRAFLSVAVRTTSVLYAGQILRNGIAWYHMGRLLATKIISLSAGAVVFQLSAVCRIIQTIYVYSQFRDFQVMFLEAIAVIGAVLYKFLRSQSSSCRMLFTLEQNSEHNAPNDTSKLRVAHYYGALLLQVQLNLSVNYSFTLVCMLHICQGPFRRSERVKFLGHDPTSTIIYGWSGTDILSSKAQLTLWSVASSYSLLTKGYTNVFYPLCLACSQSGSDLSSFLCGYLMLGEEQLIQASKSHSLYVGRTCARFLLAQVSTSNFSMQLVMPSSLEHLHIFKVDFSPTWELQLRLLRELDLNLLFSGIRESKASNILSSEIKYLMERCREWITWSSHFCSVVGQCWVHLKHLNEHVCRVLFSSVIAHNLVKETTSITTSNEEVRDISLTGDQLSLNQTSYRATFEQSATHFKYVVMLPCGQRFAFCKLYRRNHKVRSGMCFDPGGNCPCFGVASAFLVVTMRYSFGYFTDTRLGSHYPAFVSGYPRVPMLQQMCQHILNNKSSNASTLGYKAWYSKFSCL